ncbi:MAG: transposase [Bacteroidia bacterium]|nr:transposase [Bacteroidia bacterium]
MHHLRKRIAAINLTTDKQIVLRKEIKKACFKQQWVVPVKKPFNGVNSVVEYIGRHTPKVAISNHCITAVDAIKDIITFSYKDYRRGGSKKQLTL